MDKKKNKVEIDGFSPISSKPMVEVVGHSLAKGASPAKGEKKVNKSKYGPILLVAGVVLVLVLAYLLFFSQPTYKYSFNIGGVKYLSNEYTPSEFFSGVKDTNTIFVTVDLVDGNANAWVVNSLNLWLVALNGDHKNVHQIIKTVDSQGQIKSCITNDANVLVSRNISAEECGAIITNPNNFLVDIKLGNDDKALLSKNNLTIVSSSTKTVSEVNHLVIKQIYPDFDTLLAKVNEKINSVK